MRTYLIEDGTSHLPCYQVIVEEMHGELVRFQVHAKDAAHARTKTESRAREYGMQVSRIHTVEPTPP